MWGGCFINRHYAGRCFVKGCYVGRCFVKGRYSGGCFVKGRFAGGCFVNNHYVGICFVKVRYVGGCFVKGRCVGGCFIKGRYVGVFFVKGRYVGGCFVKGCYFLREHFLMGRLRCGVLFQRKFCEGTFCTRTGTGLWLISFFTRKNSTCLSNIFFFFFITSHACYKYNYIQYSIAKSVKVTIFKKSKKFTPAQNYLTVAKNRCVLYVWHIDNTIFYLYKVPEFVETDILLRKGENPRSLI